MAFCLRSLVFLAAGCLPAWAGRVLLHHAESAEGSYPGIECKGFPLTTSGSCSGFYFVRGKQVALKCYSPTPENLGAATRSGEPGKCWIPRGQPCERSRECRPGTVCVRVDDAKPEDRRCEVPDWGRAPRHADGAALAAHVATVVSGMARTFEAELREGGASGVLSAFSASPLARYVLAQVQASFRGAEARGHQANSASGASFFYSQDGLFIAKHIRDGEYFDMQKQLLGRMHKAFNFTCGEPGAPPNCWAKVALQETLLNLPVLAFRHHDECWVVLPVAEALRAYAFTGSIALRPWGKPRYYDVKPIGSNSPERTSLLRELSASDFAPKASGQSQGWVSLSQRIWKALEMLAPEGHEIPFVDYSLLFEIYDLDRDVDPPRDNCMVTTNLVEEAPGKPDKAICLTIIDYFLAYNSVLKKAESALIHHKWSGYKEKVDHLTQCLWDLSQVSDASTVATFEGGSYTVYALLDDVYPPKYEDIMEVTPGQTSADQGPIGVRVQLRQGFQLLSDMHPCQEYLDLACTAAAPKQIHRGSGELLQCAFASAEGGVTCRARFASLCYKALGSISPTNSSS